MTATLLSGEIRTLPEVTALAIATCICAENRLSLRSRELLTRLGPTDYIYVDLGPAHLYVVGFREPSEGFSAICERFGLTSVREKAWTLRIGGDRAAFRTMNARLLARDREQFQLRSYVARMRLTNGRAVVFNMRTGFIPCGTYFDNVAHDYYLLTRLAPIRLEPEQE